MRRERAPAAEQDARAELCAELRVLRRLAMTEPSMESRAWHMIDQTLDAINQLTTLGDHVIEATIHEEPEI